MINKQSLWFITLFSLILILGIYYVSMPKDALTVFSGNTDDTSKVIEITESDVIVAMKVEEEERLLAAMEEAQTILLDESASVQEKNSAFESLQLLNATKGKTLEIEKLIKETYNLEGFVKIDGNKISITLASEDKGVQTANEIIKSVQALYNSQMYITVKFQN